MLKPAEMDKKCDMCSNFLISPRKITCNHKLCVKCLQEASEKSRIPFGEFMACPLCEQEINIPKQERVFVRKEVFKKEMPCDHCVNDSSEGQHEAATATYYCIQCSKNICEHCCKRHKIDRVFKDHRILSLGSTPEDEMKSSSHYIGSGGLDRPKTTQDHLNCTNCRTTMSESCLIERRKQHMGIRIERVGEAFQNKIANDVRIMHNLAEEASANYSNFVKKQISLQNRIANEVKSVLKTENEFEEIVTDYMRSLLDETISKAEEITRDSVKEKCRNQNIICLTAKASCNAMSPEEANDSPFNITEGTSDKSNQTTEIYSDSSETSLIEEFPDLENMTTSNKEDHGHCIRRVYSKLVSCLTKIPELVGEMYQKEKLTDSELERLQQFYDFPTRATEEFLKILIHDTPDVYDCFLESLKNTNQERIFQWLQSTPEELDTDSSSIFQHSVLIRRNYCFLVNSIDLDTGLLELLYAKEVLSQQEREMISSATDRFRKNDKFLSLMRRKSEHSFAMFAGAIKESGSQWILEEINFDETSTAGEMHSEQKFKPTKMQEKNEFVPMERIADEKISSKFKSLPFEIDLTMLERSPKSVTTNEEMPEEIKFKKSTTNLISKFRSMDNELHIEVSLKMGVMQSKQRHTSQDFIWKTIIHQIQQDHELDRMVWQKELENLQQDYQCHRMEWSKERDILLQGFEREQKAQGFKLANRKEVSIKLTTQLNMPVSAEVRGLTKIKNNIYVLLHNPGSVTVFEDQNPYRFLKKIKIKSMKEPTDIVSSGMLKCLYVYDKMEGDCRCIWKMATTDDCRITKWLQFISGDSGTFSISSDDRMLILDKEQNKYQLKIYGSYRNLIRRVPLPNDILQPVHCIEKPTGEFIISHFNGSTQSYTLSQLSEEGQMINSLTQKTDISEKPFYPNYMALDYGNNQLFISDFCKHLVYVFDSNTLDVTQVILSKTENEISNPRRIFYDSEKQQLAVAHNFGMAGVYELKSRTDSI